MFTVKDREIVTRTLSMQLFSEELAQGVDPERLFMSRRGKNTCLYREDIIFTIKGA
jgi:hypothetical protein